MTAPQIASAMTAAQLRDEMAAIQVEMATMALDQSADAYKHLPWPSLDAVVGGIGPGSLWYVALFSGFGKTTLLSTFVEMALAAGERVYVMPLEATPNLFRTHLAARAVGVHPGDLLSGAYKAWPDAREVRDRVVRELERVRGQADRWTRLHISGATAFDEASVEHALDEAAAVDADWLVVDHVDHLGVQDRLSEYQVSFRANKALSDGVKQTGLRALASSQLAHTLTRGDCLARHRLPSEDMIKFGAHKRELADGVLVGCRPLRVDGVDKETLAAYRATTVPMTQVVEPNCMLLGLMKHRLYGERTGARVYLRVENGRVLDVDQSQYTGAALHGIHTGSRL